MRITTLFFAATFVVNSASAEYVAELWKGYDISPAARQSIKDAQNQDGADCCGTADGQPVDFDFKDDHYVAFWDGEWRPIPPNRVVKHLKDVKFPVIWLTKFDEESGVRDVRCFWPGAGG